MKRFICALFASLLSCAANAESYVVGVEKTQFLPYYTVDAQGQYSGYARELLDLFASNAGITFVYRPIAIQGLLGELLNGGVDFKYPDNAAWGKSAREGKNLSYSAATVDYIDGVLVAPAQHGKGLEQLKRLAVVKGWTPQQYTAAIADGQINQVDSDSLMTMIRSTVKKQADGAYYNVEVALYALNNSGKFINALQFDAGLPYNRGSFQLSTIQHAPLLKRFDQFLVEHQAEVQTLKAKYRVEENINSEFVGLEQWKIDFIKRQRAKEQTAK
ncbi:MAG: transporter substrate-binding domain-containing protein [Pseudomonadaceae bacterium]|nr:transporter substrate-binding domain-containing protein [Pseudomonadaceae bacterium]